MIPKTLLALLALSSLASAQFGRPDLSQLDVGETVEWVVAGEGSWSVTNMSTPRDPALLGLDLRQVLASTTSLLDDPPNVCKGKWNFVVPWAAECDGFWQALILANPWVAISPNCGGCRPSASFIITSPNEPGIPQEQFGYFFVSDKMDCGAVSEEIPIHCPDDPDNELVWRNMVISCTDCPGAG